MTKTSSRGSVLERVMRLRPKAYEYREEYRDAGSALPSGIQYGFIAQELERVFPALVSERLVERIRADGRSRRLRAKAVDYMGLIAVLVAAMQEQQRAIEAQARKLELVARRHAHRKRRSGAKRTNTAVRK